MNASLLANLQLMAIGFPLLGMMWLGLNKLVNLYGNQIQILSEVRENTRILNVAIESMRILDGDLINKTEGLDRRLSDIEYYMRQYTSPEPNQRPSHQFVSRDKRTL